MRRLYQTGNSLLKAIEFDAFACLEEAVSHL